MTEYKKALITLFNSVELAQRKGCYSLDDAALIIQAINIIKDHDNIQNNEKGKKDEVAKAVDKTK